MSSFTRFLDSPEEIQHLILVEHFSSTSVSVRLADGEPPQTIRQQLLAIPLTNKALHDRSMSIFYKHVLFHDNEPYDLRDWHAPSLLTRARCISTGVHGAWGVQLAHEFDRGEFTKVKHIVVKDKSEWDRSQHVYRFTIAILRI